MPTTLPGSEELHNAQQQIGVTFSEPQLLLTALTHQSYLNENTGVSGESNERLEFLGDSALNYLVGRFLYEELPDLPEGDLTVRRAEAVRRETLENAARRLSLGNLLVMGNGEAASGGAERSSNLADAFEAVVGALVLDQGITRAGAKILKWLGPELDELKKAETPKDPKSQLQELLQARSIAPPEYRVVNVTGPDNSPEFTIEAVVQDKTVGSGTAGRKVDAEREAARQAIEALE